MASVKLSTKAEGSVVKIKLDGAWCNFIVVHQGVPSSLYDASCNGTWLVQEDVPILREWSTSNSNAYAGSSIHSYLNGAYLSSIDSAIRGYVKQVKIPYGVGNGSSTVYSGGNGLSARVFLPSGYEVGLTAAAVSGLPVDGVRLSYFSEGLGTTACARRTARFDGENRAWWLRSPRTNDGARPHLITVEGSDGSAYATLPYGMRPEFILPDTMLVNDNGEVFANNPPTISSASSGDLGEKSAGFSVAYTVHDADGDTVMVTEALDGETLRSFTALLGEENTCELTGDRFQQMLNGNHTLRITATDTHHASAVLSLTFTKAIHTCRITLEQPMLADDQISKLVLHIVRELPEDVEFQVLATNNANDPQPAWEDITALVKAGRNHVFSNAAAENGAAFNFIVTATRGPSGQGGYIGSIGGAFA